MMRTERADPAPGIGAFRFGPEDRLVPGPEERAVLAEIATLLATGRAGGLPRAGRPRHLRRQWAAVRSLHLLAARFATGGCEQGDRLPGVGGRSGARAAVQAVALRAGAPSCRKPCYPAPGVDGMLRRPSVPMRWIWVLPLGALLSTLAAVPAAAHPVGIGALSATGPSVLDTLLAFAGPSAAEIIGWVWVALLALTAVLAVRRWPRPSALVLAALLVWLSARPPPTPWVTGPTPIRPSTAWCVQPLSISRAPSPAERA